jgi:hypothetical protein
MIHEAKGFLAISTERGSWGRGNTLDEAVKHCKVNTRAERGKAPMVIIAATCPATSIEVYAGVTLEYRLPPDHSAMRFEGKF